MSIISHWHNLSYNSKLFNIFIFIKIIHLDNCITELRNCFELIQE